MANRRYFFIACVCFAVAFVLRLGLLFGSGLYDRIERREMTAVAATLARTGQYADPYLSMPTGPTAHVAPGYTLLLAGVFRVFGDGPTGEHVKQVIACAISSARSPLLVLLAMTFGLGEGVALAAGLLSAVYIGAFDTELRGNWEGPFAGDLLLLLVIWAHRIARQRIPGPPMSALYGVAWGAALLVSPSLLPVVAGLIALAVAVTARNSPRAFTLSLACFAAGVMLTLSPWIVRNYRVLGGFVWGRSNFGLELDVSNGPGAIWSNAGQERMTLVHPSRSRAAAMRLLAEGELAFQAERKRDAIAWISTHPGEFAVLTLQRVFHFWFSYGRGILHQAALMLFTMLAFAGLAILARRNTAAFWLTAVTWAVYPLAYYVIQWSSRYRQPIEWSLILCAGLTIHALVVRRAPQRKRGGDDRRFIPWSESANRSTL